VSERSGQYRSLLKKLALKKENTPRKSISISSFQIMLSILFYPSPRFAHFVLCAFFFVWIVGSGAIGSSELLALLPLVYFWQFMGFFYHCM